MDNQHEPALSSQDIVYRLSRKQGLQVTALGRANAAPWVTGPRGGPAFTVVCNDQQIDGHSADFQVQQVEQRTLDGQRSRLSVFGNISPFHLEIEHHTLAFPGSTLLEQWVTVRNSGAAAVRISRLDAITLDLVALDPAASYELMYFTSDWGAEFESIREPLDRTGKVLETRAGRSSKGQHPWFALLRNDGEILSASVLWSGNWVFRFEPLPEGGIRLSGGLHDWAFFKDLQPGEAVESPHVALALGGGGDLNSVSIQYGRVGRRYWYPHNALSESLPVEWNHWWSYEDKAINEEVFRQNVEKAKELGIEVCTLDAGWFGPTDPATHWYHYRGDWDLVNTTRFPSGMRALADHVHRHGMRFGLWCEIEGLGKDAALATTHPEFVAARDGARLGYVCFGNPAVQEWAFATLDRLITGYGCDWIKLDFNLDPGAGCNRTDHGHGAGDGLFEHYRGYYRTLERVRARHPEVILESCSSGGLRIDLGLLQRTYMTFLSDPDWPVHDLQLYWGATTMLAPNACLHWSYSEWLGDRPHQSFNPRDPNLTQRQLDYYTIIAQLGVFGISQKLPELPQWVAERLAHHVRVYQRHIKRFVRSGDVYRLTGQPRRDGSGERWAAFQYSLPESDEHLLFVFRLDGSEPERVLRLAGLAAEQDYQLEWLTGERAEQYSGHSLMTEGLCFSGMAEEEAALVQVRPA
ncbi:MAG TPA: alpha-galactosidase [Caldilineaceae bacterium]|nr:alpha-galactosidase [Caldilineaceae bacterium]